MKRKQKATEIRNRYKPILISHPFGKKYPVYFNNWAQRILKIEYLLIDIKYKQAI